MRQTLWILNTFNSGPDPSSWSLGPQLGHCSTLKTSRITRSLERNWERCLASRPPALPHRHHVYLTTIVAVPPGMVVLFVVIGLLVYWLCKARQDLKRALTEQEVKMFEVSSPATPSILCLSLAEWVFFSGGWSQLHQPKTRPFGTGGPFALRQEVRVPDEQGERP